MNKTATLGSCMLCGASQFEILVPDHMLLPDQASVLKCQNCNLVFLGSLECKNEIQKEEATYWDSEDQKNIYMDQKIQATFVKEFEDRLDAIERLTARVGRLLDVGCGVGHFLATARKRGWEVEGLDISHAASTVAERVYGFKVHVGTLEHASLPKEGFDVVALWDVIEHIRKPIENLKAANQILREGGILAIKTPNEAGLFKQLVLGLYRTFGRPAAFLLKYVYYIPHYYSYTRKSLDLLLRRSGFEMARYEMDVTSREFAAEKIKVHYKNDSKHSWIITFLPLVYFFSKLLRKGNKMIVYARKVRTVT